MSDLFEIITYPLKKIAQLLFSLTIGNTNLGSLFITAAIFVVLIAAIMHGGNLIGRIGDLANRIRNRRSGNSSE